MEQLPLFDLTALDDDLKETDTWVKAVNEAARECDDVLREQLDMSPFMHLAKEDPDVQKATDKFMRIASGGKYRLKDLPLIIRKESVPGISNPLKRGAKVCAKTAITFADQTRIEPGTIGRIVTSGQLACNVHFEGYSKNHHVLCSWDMLLEVVNS